MNINGVEVSSESYKLWLQIQKEELELWQRTQFAIKAMEEAKGSSLTPAELTALIDLAATLRLDPRHSHLRPRQVISRRPRQR